MKPKFLLSAACCLGAVCAFPAAAQNNNHITFDAGAGFSEPVRATDGRVNTGFNVNAGVGVNFVPAFGLKAEFGFNRFDLSDRSLNTAGVPGGNARVYSVTLAPIVRFHPHGRFDPYVIGGGGFYRRTVDFTQPTIATGTVFDPFYGFSYPVAYPANTVLASFVQNKMGWNVGAGFEVQVKGDSNAKFFAETRYHRIYTTPVRTEMLPVEFGFRW
jgi:opacity protein-like surface antigen